MGHFFEVFWSELRRCKYFLSDKPGRKNSHVSGFRIRESRFEDGVLEPFSILLRQGRMPAVEKVEFNGDDVAFTNGGEAVVKTTDGLDTNAVRFRRVEYGETMLTVRGSRRQSL